MTLSRESLYRWVSEELTRQEQVRAALVGLKAQVVQPGRSFDMRRRITMSMATVRRVKANSRFSEQLRKAGLLGRKR
jgi:sulfate adenylyltransferase subunit 1 (EFTu-like GTPase family)